MQCAIDGAGGYPERAGDVLDSYRTCGRRGPSVRGHAAILPHEVRPAAALTPSISVHIMPPAMARVSAAAIAALLFVFEAAPRQEAPVSIRVDASARLEPMKPVWAFFGYDEPNYTYMKDGRTLLSELAALSPVPVYVRTHNLLTTGDGSPSLKWGSTNAYTEADDGKPRYDWTIVDRILGTYLERGMKP